MTSLQTLPGVGPKVADCVALFSCDKLEAVPVDTHVWSFAVKDYGLAKGIKSLTASAYREIGMDRSGHVTEDVHHVILIMQ